ncbi:hypothetical protein L207DRAFT_590050 [Hyaloscypha variabilis F]|uniref:Uncharacterized protein n=1 Tax=Hyaloscypha variabilis (strain UAMH 11265 / GT02V1 / F) TaxID=1149755 RepID=A0A2J6R387_HYAVF|nr:hypothetical protein L207DRAFT_590050 [Hyaloscypha variabilis F]
MSDQDLALQAINAVTARSTRLRSHKSHNRTGDLRPLQAQGTQVPTIHATPPTEIERHSLKGLELEDLVAGVLDTVPFYAAMEDTAVLIELFHKRLDVLNTRLEVLQQLSAPLKAPPPPPLSPTSLLRLPFEIRLQIYHYYIPRKYAIEVSGTRFYIRWPFEEKDHTVDLEDALDFEDDTLGLEGAPWNWGLRMI